LKTVLLIKILNIFFISAKASSLQTGIRMMKDLGIALLKKKSAIVEEWINAVRLDFEFQTTKELSFNAVRDSIPSVLEAIASLLTQAIADQPRNLEQKSVTHGLVRAEQGYDTTEIIREYCLLRETLFSQLAPELLTLSNLELLATTRMINVSFDTVVSFSIESYIQSRLQEYAQIQNQLLLTNQELTRLVSSQTDNLSHLSHELKNHLNSIMGFSELLLNQRQTQAFNQEQLDLDVKLIKHVLSNSHQLLRLINDVSEVSHFDLDQVRLDIMPINVSSLVLDTAKTLENPEQEDIKMMIDCERAPRQVLTDPLRLQQIITNVISNALDYTETGIINVTCQMTDEDQWSLVVADTGRGISSEDQAHIFEPYFRAGSEENYVPQSTGLGLAIVAKLVKRLKGKIRLVSELGKGTTFTLTFPCKTPDLSVQS